jgi:hypothetical protein
VEKLARDLDSERNPEGGRGTQQAMAPHPRVPKAHIEERRCRLARTTIHDRDSVILTLKLNMRGAGNMRAPV